MTKPKYNQDGITLVEVMVSIVLFGITLSALMYLLNNVLTSADDLRQNTIAAGLAQEGLEVVRNIRDQDWIPDAANPAGQPFGTEFKDGKWEVQWNSDTLMPDTSRLLKKDPATGMFNYTTGNDTQFKRTIEIIPVSADEKIASISVSWKASNGGYRTLQAESHLYNWY